ncbi:macrophage migration inhibitory factor-like protein [Senna tora]|uniref:Macrophage migration inhibitory factor-like protein n=1 Tax=Senna tora TaxID=362788 RepID=A0A834XHM7_9FABA|nr:macrophage migration inhibitory factor-like protein [Senna tora]
MPCLYITTNVNLHEIDTDPIFSETTSAVSSIIGKPKKFVMVVLKGSVPISFEGNKEAAAYAEIVSMGGITKQVKRNLIATLGSILHHNLSIPTSRFFLKVFDTTASPFPNAISKL